MDVFEFALQLEQDGKTFYIEQAAASDDAGLETIFSRLADDEERHYQTVKRIREGSSLPATAQSTALDEAKNIFARINEDGATSQVADYDLAAYRQAMKIEQESCRLYRDAAEREQNDAVRNVLLQLAREEQEHYEILDNVYNFINAPNQYLAWREFSNLEEFHNFGRNVDLREDE